MDNNLLKSGMVATFAKATIGIGLVSLVAANFMSSDDNIVARIAGSDRQQLAALADRLTADPSVTGSIGRRAQDVKLDPCVVR